MKKNVFVVLIILFTFHTLVKATENNAKEPVFGLVIHGGAGTIKRENLDFETEEKIRQKLKEALKAGYKVLENNGTAVDAVEAAINVLEDSPLFNAGRGAVFTNSETNELDCSIMDGKTLNAGAAAGVRHVKNPISLAKLIMKKSNHVMLSGMGAEEFARRNGLAMMPDNYFATEKRLKQLKKLKNKKISYLQDKANENHKFGTVGAVALDKEGNIAAGTSTGGMTNKKFGRIGDSPIIGAGTYADNLTCGVSCTGWGEFFIRTVAAYDISAQIFYKRTDLKTATKRTINKIEKLGGSGGVIALNTKGEYVFTFNTKGMYRGVYLSKSNPIVKIFANE